VRAAIASPPAPPPPHSYSAHCCVGGYSTQPWNIIVIVIPLSYFHTRLVDWAALPINLISLSKYINQKDDDNSCHSQAFVRSMAIVTMVLYVLRCGHSLIAAISWLLFSRLCNVDDSTRRMCAVRRTNRLAPPVSWHRSPSMPSTDGVSAPARRGEGRSRARTD
jgi:hypothetical protein